MDVDNLELFNTAPSEATTSLTTVATFCTPAIPIMSSGHKKSPNTTPINASPGVTTPKTSSSPTNQPFNKFTDPKFIDEYVGQRLLQEKSLRPCVANSTATRPQNSTFRNFYNGLDPIPEYRYGKIDFVHKPASQILGF